MKGAPELVFQTPAGEHYFAGYYDKSPLDGGNRLLLVQRASFMGRMCQPEDVLDIGIFDWRNGNEFAPLAETRAWNWQQGCMLQWLGPDHDRFVIYNDRHEGRFVSVIMDVQTGKKHSVLPMAVYTVSSDGARALCIDNERHYWFRPGYNYQGIVNPEKRKPVDDRDGIWLLDLRTHDVSQVVNIRTLLHLQPLSNMQGAIHYLEHLMFSPSGRRFCFLHRWRLADGGVYSRLYAADANGDNLSLLSDSGRMSHFSWLDDGSIVAYGGMANPLNRLRRERKLVRHLVRPLLPLYHAVVPRKSALRHRMTGDSYMVIRDPGGECRRLAPEELREDGHPTQCPALPGLLLSDTYEDSNHQREVFLFDMQAGTRTWSARLKSIQELDSTGMRCDLHPKWSFDGAFFSIDTMNDGCRSVYLYALHSSEIRSFALRS